MYTRSLAILSCHNHIDTKEEVNSNSDINVASDKHIGRLRLVCTSEQTFILKANHFYRFICVSSYQVTHGPARVRLGSKFK